MDTTDTTIGRELYKYNEAQNAVTLVKNINPSTTGFDRSSRILFLTKFDNKLFFRASNGAEEKLYVSDGTNAGTVVVENAELLNYFDPRKLQVFNNELYFAASKTGVGRDLYKCRKNIQNEYVIELVYNFNPLGNPNEPPFEDLVDSGRPLFYEINNELYFFAREQSAPNNGNNYQIYKTNGINTQIAFTIGANLVGPALARPRTPIVFNGKIFFEMSGNGSLGVQLWVADPATSSVTRLTNSSNQPSQIQSTKLDGFGINGIVFNNNLYFRARNTNEGDELWKLSDATLSTLDFEDIQNILINPNPVANILNIQAENINNFTIEIFDIIGKKVGQFKNQNQLDISNYKSGIYLLKITDLQTNKSKTHKIIKQQ